jgi:DNA polymerase (family 10)
VENADVVRILSDIADILDLTGGNPFRARAYRQAAATIDTLPVSLAELRARGQLRGIPGIGERIAELIEEALDRGLSPEWERLSRQVPAGVLEMLRLEGVGPKTAAAVWSLGIVDLDHLEHAARSGELRRLKGMGPVRARAIADAISRYRNRAGRTQLHRALFYADALLRRLRAVPGVVRAEAAGSLRRRRETVGNLDLLVAARDPERCLRAFTELPEAKRVIAAGPTKASVELTIGLQADLRVVEPRSFGAALQYFTGSKAHNIALRGRALGLGLKVNEYGVFDGEGRRLGGETEEEVYRRVDLPWIPPELREGAGEIEAAAAGRLPRLVEEREVLGDLHIHTRPASSDARSTPGEIAAEAARLGRRYLALTEHSRSRPLGLDGRALLDHALAIRALDRELGGRPRLLAGIEVDILGDGSLDLPEEVLASLDWVVASIHAGFHDPPERITARLLAAIRSGVVDAIGHPSGRQLGRRDPYDFDLGAVLEAAREHGVALEINAMPDRLDLADRACRAARVAGVRLVIDSDAHNARHLQNLRLGVWVARRGWLEAADVVNTRPVEEVLAARRNRTRPVPGIHPS